jgi:integrase
MHDILAQNLRDWHNETPYANDSDFVFPSLRGSGKLPVCASVLVADHLRPAGIKAGVQIAKGQRFGFHNLRHSLSNWLVNKGNLWAGAFWQVRSSIGQDVTDKLLAAAWKHFAIPPAELATIATFRDELVRQDTALYCGAHIQQIRSAFQARGLKF